MNLIYLPDCLLSIKDYDRVNPATRAYAMAKFEAESKGEVFNMNTPRTDLAVGRLLGLNLKL